MTEDQVATAPRTDPTQVRTLERVSTGSGSDLVRDHRTSPGLYLSSLRFFDCCGEIFQVSFGPLELGGIGRSKAAGIGALTVTNEMFQLAQIGRGELRHCLLVMYVRAVFPAHL